MTLDKNLKALKPLQPEIVKLIEATPISEKVCLFKGHFDDVNIAYEEIALHRINDPGGEALETFEQGVPEDQRTEQSLIFMYGLGLGYLLRRSYVSSQSTLIIYEPYPEVLRQTLELVDLSEEIASKRVWFVTSPDQLLNALSRWYIVGDPFNFLALPSYREKEPEILLEVLDELNISMSLCITTQSTDISQQAIFTQNALNNLGTILRYPDAGSLKNTCPQKHGVVVSAGPSLDQPGVLDTLKAQRDKLIICAVGQAAKALDKAGITPDFVCMLESKDITLQLKDVSFTPDVNLLVLPQANPKILALPTRRKFVAYTSNQPFIRWVSHATGQDMEPYDHDGTVSLTALQHLIKLGCNPIFLVGQDLACPDGKMYAQNSVYANCRFILGKGGQKVVQWDNKDDFFGVDGFMDSEADWHKFQFKFGGPVTRAKDWYGNTILSQRTYDVFRRCFERVPDQYPDLTLVNCSVGGSFIKGFEHLPFDEALTKYPPADPQAAASLEAYIQTHYQELSADHDIFQKVQAQFAQDKDMLMSLKKLLPECIEEMTRVIRELSQKRVLTHSLEARVRKLDQKNAETLTRLRQQVLINDYIQHALLRYTQKNKRRTEQPAGAVDWQKVMSALEDTLFLYEAALDGTHSLLDAIVTAEHVLESRPASAETARVATS